MAQGPRRSHATLHAVAVGLAAFCLFAAQPLAAKVCLPRLGGTPAVWNAVSLFFQVGLLVAYLSAHAIARRLRPKAQAWIYALTLSAACALAWARTPAQALAAGEPGDFGGLLLALAGYLGLPAFALGLSTPLWSHRHVAAKLGDPYWLYAASNLGSFFALLAYPFVLEPWLGVTHSFDLWRVALSALTLLALYTALRPGELARVQVETMKVEGRAALGWALAAGLVAAYSLALTVHLSTDLAPAPWLWSLPLAVYLATYVLAFSKYADMLRARVAPLAPLVAAVNVVLIVLEVSRPTPGVLAALLIGEFFIGLTIHLELARRRPPPAASTAFYGWIALGGCMGALVVTVLAPTLSDRSWDLPLILAACLFAFPKDEHSRTRPSAGLALSSAALVGVAMWLLWGAQGPTRPEGTVRAFAFAAWLPLFWPAFRWPRVAARVSAALLLFGLLAFESNAKVLALARSKVSAYRVTEDPKTGVRALAHGRTIHGSQSSAPELAGWALPYHHPRSPIGQRFAALDQRLHGPEQGPDVAVLGLGVGNMAAQAGPRWRMLFFEIDPLVEELAREHFDFLARCADCEVVIADGRIGLARTQPVERRFDMIVLDAFSSDAVPLHLLTREALESYVARLAEGGEIMVHITNRHVDLRGPLADLAAALELSAHTRGYAPDLDAGLPDAARGIVAPTMWVRLTRPGTPAPEGWAALPAGEGSRAWTDDRASIFAALGQAIPEGG